MAHNIVGFYRGANFGDFYGFLATPVPEPSALTFLALSAAGFFVLRRFRGERLSEERWRCGRARLFHA
jgi:hypothetical protein